MMASRISTLWLIGIGTGNPGHVTLEGMQAIREADTILLPLKGDEKEALAALRRGIIAASGAQGRIVNFDYPERDPVLPYQQRVAEWHDRIAKAWAAALGDVSGTVALLVWGDPALYDSTMRIAERLDPRPRIRVVPGISAVQALTAAHAVPLNSVNGAITITTGRQLRDHGWPEGADSVVVMLDGECSFAGLHPDGLHIWWGAYLGSADQILMAGPLTGIRDSIIQCRAKARARHGWIMDSYLLRRTGAAQSL